ncbi:MAG: albusnodin family lasso peptide [Pseudonocardiaceae bacterium]
MTKHDDNAPADQETQIEVIELGNAADLTLGSGGGNSEDKRRIYN